MKRILRKTFCILSCFVLLASMCSCGDASTSTVGSGTPGVIDPIDWSLYDNYLSESRKESDPIKRALLLHQAEDLLVGTGLIIPLFSGTSSYLVKPDISGLCVRSLGILNYSQLHSASGQKDISVCIISEPTNLDSVANSTSDTCHIASLIMSTLVKLDSENNIVPDLASSYDVSSDERTYTFHLRENLKWCEGSPMDAHDFEYAWRRAAASENAFTYGSLFDVIEGYPDQLNVHASEDGKVFTVTLNDPCPYFLDLCAFTPFAPVNKNAVESAKGYKDIESGKVLNPSAWAQSDSVIGCGPYYVSKWKHREDLVLEKNPYYYNADQIEIERIHHMMTADSTSAYAAYVAGDICILLNSIPDDVIPLLKDSPEYHTFDLMNSGSIAVNPNADIFKGMTKEEAITFRQAIGWAVDREFMIQVGLSGMMNPGTTFVPTWMKCGQGMVFKDTPGYTYPEGDGYYANTGRPDKARELLRSIGFEFDSNGKLKEPITIEYMYNTNARNEAVAVCLQADLAQIGINIIPATREWSVYLGERDNQHFETSRYTWTADYNDPYGMLQNFLGNAPSNCIKFK